MDACEETLPEEFRAPTPEPDRGDADTSDYILISNNSSTPFPLPTTVPVLSCTYAVIKDKENS